MLYLQYQRTQTKMIETRTGGLWRPIWGILKLCSLMAPQHRSNETEPSQAGKERCRMAEIGQHTAFATAAGDGIEN